MISLQLAANINDSKLNSSMMEHDRSGINVTPDLNLMPGANNGTFRVMSQTPLAIPDDSETE